MPSWVIGTIYKFNTAAPGILGAVVDNAKLSAILDYNTALLYDNIDLKWRSILPVILTTSPNTQDTPAMSQYYLFTTQSGTKIVLADIWIQMSTVQVVQYVSFQLNFTKAQLTDITIVKNALNALGYNNFTIVQNL